LSGKRGDSKRRPVPSGSALISGPYPNDGGANHRRATSATASPPSPSSSSSYLLVGADSHHAREYLEWIGMKGHVSRRHERLADDMVPIHRTANDDVLVITAN